MYEHDEVTGAVTAVVYCAPLSTNGKGDLCVPPITWPSGVEARYRHYQCVTTCVAHSGAAKHAKDVNWWAAVRYPIARSWESEFVVTSSGRHY